MMAEKQEWDFSISKDRRMICEATFPNDVDDHSEGNARKKLCLKNQHGGVHLETCNSEGSEDRDINTESIASNAEQMESGVSERNTKFGGEEIYYCNLCKAHCNGLLSYRVHINGGRHAKNGKRAQVLKQLKMDKVIPDDDESVLDDSLKKLTISQNGFYCQICGKVCNGPEPFKQHLEGDGHKKKLEMTNPFTGTSCKAATGSSESENMASVSCDICNKVFAGPFTYELHMKDPSHLQQAEEATKAEKYKELLQSTEDERMTHCRLCNKYFTGTVPYEIHMRSKSHNNVVEKMEMIVMIREKYPDIKIVEGEVLEHYKFSCSVCEISLSGPESAQEHAEGKKHKEMKEEKAEPDQMVCDEMPRQIPPNQIMKDF